MNRLINFVSGLLMGAIVGATIAVMLAPASGEELQSQIRERVEYVRSEAQKAAAQRRAELEDQLAHLRTS